MNTLSTQTLINCIVLSAGLVLFGTATANDAKENPAVENLQTKKDSTESNENTYPSVAASERFSEEFQQKLYERSSAHQVSQSIKDETPLNKDINYYVRGLMQDLMANLEFVNNKTPIAISSFVLLDSDYNESNLLGLQLSESFIHEVHKFGIPVIDYKATGDIQVTDSGDFFFSRDPSMLEGNLPIRYVLGGTITKQQGGYLVNARIIGVSSKAVVASAQGFISAEASEAILQHQRKSKSPTVLLTKG